MAFLFPVFILSALFSVFLVFVFRRVYLYFNLVDDPARNTRTIHKRKIPYGGGMVLFVAFFSILASGLWYFGMWGEEVPRLFLCIFIGAVILMVGGYFDDKYDLPARIQILFPILASIFAVLSGIAPAVVTNPLGGVIEIGSINLPLLGISVASVLVFVWLMGIMYTTKLLDGLDGLSGGIVFIGALFIGFFSLQDKWFDPVSASLAFVFAGVLLGFLLFNWPPAKIFLGEGGSLLIGFILAILSILSGSKIAITLLTLGVPALDVLRVIVLRLRRGKSIHAGGKEHLHHRLLALGLGPKRVIVLMYSISIVLGLVAVSVQSRAKLITFVGLCLLMLLLVLAYDRGGDCVKKL